MTRYKHHQRTVYHNMTNIMIQLLTQLSINIKDVYLFGHVDLIDGDGKCFGVVIFNNGHLHTRFWKPK